MTISPSALSSARDAYANVYDGPGSADKALEAAIEAYLALRHSAPNEAASEVSGQTDPRDICELCHCKVIRSNPCLKDGCPHAVAQRAAHPYAALATASRAEQEAEQSALSGGERAEVLAPSEAARCPDCGSPVSDGLCWECKGKPGDGYEPGPDDAEFGMREQAAPSPVPKQRAETDAPTLEERVRHLELYGTANVDSWLDIILKRLDGLDAALSALPHPAPAAETPYQVTCKNCGAAVMFGVTTDKTIFHASPTADTVAVPREMLERWRRQFSNRQMFVSEIEITRLLGETQ